MGRAFFINVAWEQLFATTYPFETTSSGFEVRLGKPECENMYSILNYVVRTRMKHDE